MSRLRLSADLVRRALSGHAALGLLAGALLYILCLSGTLIVVHEEWQRWEQPTIPEMTRIDPDAVQRASAAMLASEPRETEHFYVHFPSEALPRTILTTDNRALYIDGAGEVAAPEAHGWTEFMVYLHYYLHMPMLWGLLAVGALGVMMASLIVGGVLAHPRIFRDAFRLRARAQTQLRLADWHNRLGVWTLPFGLAIAITGALIGLSVTMTQLSADRWYGGDIEAAYEPIFGAEGAHDEAPAPLADIAAAIRDFRARFPDVRLAYVLMHDPGTAGQHLRLLGDHPRRLIFGEYYVYDPAGRFVRSDGMADGTIGQQLAASTYKLHFGNFGGLPVKLAYILMGIALTVVAGTGMAIWLAKRRQRGRASPRLEAGWQIVLWGTPLLIALALPLCGLLGPEAPMVPFFWGGLALMLAAAAIAPNAAAWRQGLMRALAASLALIAIGHAALAGPAFALLWFNGALLALAALFVALTWRRRDNPARVLAPAE